MADASILERAISPAEAVDALGKRGVKISERSLREKARLIGAYRQIGKAMFFLPSDLERIMEPTACSRTPSVPKARTGSPAARSTVSELSEARAKLLEHFKETALGDIDNVAMARAANALYPGRAPATIRRHLYVPVSAIINFVKDDKLRAPKGGGARTMFVMPSLADNIIKAATSQPSPWLPALITFLFGQGTRAGETFAIDGRDDISLDGRWVMLRDPKNGHERWVTLQPRVVAALSLLPNIGEPGPLFRRFDGKPFKEKTGRGGQVRTAFARAVETGGGDPKVITPHVCRHSWATWFYSQTKDSLRLKEEGGWLSNEHQRYVKLGTPEIGQDAFARGWDFRLTGEGKLGESGSPRSKNRYLAPEFRP